jgi:hypothetical protein
MGARAHVGPTSAAGWRGISGLMDCRAHLQPTQDDGCRGVKLARAAPRRAANPLGQPAPQAHESSLTPCRNRGE